MKQYSAAEIRNVAFLGHGSSGKTTLIDAVLFESGIIDRIGKSADGTLSLDFDPEERKRKVSLSTAVFPLERKGVKFNIIDAPGLLDFAGGVTEAISAADSAVIVLSGKSGVNVGSELCFERAKAMDKPCAFFVGKLNSTHASFTKVCSQITGHYGALACPVTAPVMEGDAVKYFVNLIDLKAYEFDGVKAKEVAYTENDAITNLRNLMLEAVASVDEELMEKYFGGEEFTYEETIAALKKGFISGDICPIFAGINQTGEGVSLLFDILADIAPTPLDVGYKALENGEEKEYKYDPDGPAVISVFKTVADPFVGKMSCFKVMSGKVKTDTKLINVRNSQEEKLGKVMFIKGAKQEDADFISAGDLGAVAKLNNVLSGDTLCAAGAERDVKQEDFPVPCLSMAVVVKNKGEEEKATSGLNRLIEEDPSLKLYNNKETREQIIMGLGEQHLDVVVSKLKNKFGVDIELKNPRIAYRETIRKKVKVQGRHKKQSGGHGQFGDVWIEFEPCGDGDLVFEEKIFGGAVPKNFFPAVEKGLRDCVAKGVLAGYPMVGIKATLVDGSYHPVDSSEMSFKMAAAVAYKAGIPDAKPVLLEPIGTLKVIVPDDNMGDVIGDINKRRGRVLGMNPMAKHRQEVVAEVPMAEMGDFPTAMRSITQGRATFTFEFERYEDAPESVAKKVIEESAGDE